MERNNGVTAIIYLAFVRNRTLQPYFRSANTDAIFHSLTISPSPKLQMGFKHPFQPGHRPLATSLSFLEDPFEKKQKRRGEKNEEEKKDSPRDPQTWQSKGLRPSTKSEWSQKRFWSWICRWMELPHWTEHILTAPFIRPRVDRCSDVAAGSRLCCAEHDTAAHCLPDKTIY